MERIYQLIVKDEPLGEDRSYQVGVERFGVTHSCLHLAVALEGYMSTAQRLLRVYLERGALPVSDRLPGFKSRQQRRGLVIPLVVERVVDGLPAFSAASGDEAYQRVLLTLHQYHPTPDATIQLADRHARQGQLLDALSQLTHGLTVVSIFETNRRQRSASRHRLWQRARELIQQYQAALRVTSMGQWANLGIDDCALPSRWPG